MKKILAINDKHAHTSVYRVALQTLHAAVQTDEG